MKCFNYHPAQIQIKNTQEPTNQKKTINIGMRIKEKKKKINKQDEYLFINVP